MAIDPGTLKALIKEELASLSDARVLNCIRQGLVEPRVDLRGWDYGAPGQEYPCWIVFWDEPTGAEVAYCEHGFGPDSPWGIFITDGVADGQHITMGMDTSWFTSFLDAVFDSFAVTNLPIWRVFKTGPDWTRVPLSEEGSWDATWEQVYALRLSDPAGRYDCDHSISYGR